MIAVKALLVVAMGAAILMYACIRVGDDDLDDN